MEKLMHWQGKAYSKDSSPFTAGISGQPFGPGGLILHYKISANTKKAKHYYYKTKVLAPTHRWEKNVGTD